MSLTCKNIILTGFMGAGKTTVGRILARRCGFEFVDVDERIVTAQGRSIPEIFAEEGEACFRDYETAALEALKNSSKAVIATGGGIIMRAENRRLLHQLGVVVYLRAAFETLVRRVAASEGRPLADLSQGAERLQALFESRITWYEEADVVVDTDHTDGAGAALSILEAVKKEGAGD